MQKFDPSSMPSTTSPTVRSLRTFVERSVEHEVEKVAASHGDGAAKIAEDALRSLAYTIFHKNPEVHTRVREDMFAFDSAIQQLFNIVPEEV